MSVLISSRLAAITGAVCHARNMQLPWGARGKCYLSALMVADIADQEGIETWLAAFLLNRDDYWDHWAVAERPDSPYLYDPSFAQVWGRGGRVCTHAPHDYPPNYDGPLYYPARAFLPAYRAWIAGQLSGHALIDNLLGTTAEFDGGVFQQHVKQPSKARR
ncbi:MAG: hypothetical protein QMD73_13260 [Rhodocyclaceae bacterium]|nr:hypothetical protein [Rhodocyclaceae bacterium]